MKQINHLAAIVAAVAYFLWGWLWFTVFGKQWMALVAQGGVSTAGSAGMGMSPMPYIIAFIVALVLAYVTSIALADSTQRSAMHGLQFGLFFGIGIYASISLVEHVFQQRPLALWLLDAGYPVIGLAIIGAIVGGWPARRRTV